MADPVSAAEPRAGRTAVLFGVMGIAGAAIVCDSIHAGCFGHDGPLRGVLAVLAPAGMAAAGGVIGALANRGHGPRCAIVNALVMLAMGALIGGLVGLVCWPSSGGVVLGARDGFVFGAAALAVCAPVLWMMRRLARVPAGSVAAQSRQIVTWCAGGLSMATGATLALAADRPFGQCARGGDSTALVVVAVLGALVSLVSAIAAARMASRARRLCVAPLQAAAPSGPLALGPARVDLGIGEGLWVAPRNEGPYRHAPAQQADFLGDPLVTLRSLHLDEVHAIVCAAAALGVAALTLALARARAPLSPTIPDGPPYGVAWISAAPAKTRAARGPSDEEVVSREFDLNARHCFREWWNVDPDWGGRLAISLRVSTSGSVDYVTVPRRKTLSADEARCLEHVGEQAQFAPRAMSETLEVLLPFYLP